MGCINSVLKRNEQTQDNRLDISNRGERSSISQDLVNINWKDTKPFVVPLSDGVVIKVYDGDTITIANRLPIDNCNDILAALWQVPIYNVNIDVLVTTHDHSCHDESAYNEGKN